MRVFVFAAGLALATTSARGIEHALLEVSVAAHPVAVAKATRDAPEPVRRQPSPAEPKLRDGDRWICAVGQSPTVNRQLFARAKSKGWGFWSFPPHARCPAGIYPTIVRNGELRAAEYSLWNDEPDPTDDLTRYISPPANHRSVATRTMTPGPLRPAYSVASSPAWSAWQGTRAGSGWGGASACSTCVWPESDGVGSGDGACGSAVAGWPALSGGVYYSQGLGGNGSYCASCQGEQRR